MTTTIKDSLRNTVLDELDRQAKMPHAAKVSDGVPSFIVIDMRKPYNPRTIDLEALLDAIVENHI